MRRTTLGMTLAAFGLIGLSCAETQSGEQRVRIIKNPETAAPVGGIPPDKEAEVQLLLQQRDSSTTKCYQDVLNEKHDRKFKGTVIVQLRLEPSGKASDVKVTGGSLNNKEVADCLVEKLKEFEYPQVENAGSMQYTYRFEPAY